MSVIAWIREAERNAGKEENFSLLPKRVYPGLSQAFPSVSLITSAYYDMLAMKTPKHGDCCPLTFRSSDIHAAYSFTVASTFPQAAGALRLTQTHFRLTLGFT